MKGATPRSAQRKSKGRSFNPRAREGRDNVTVQLVHKPKVSIHAPVKGATFEPRLVALTLVVSIHAPVKGATPGARNKGDNMKFQSTRP